MQSLVVNPNQQSRELPYIDRNVEATREAMRINLDDVDAQGRRRSGTITTADVENDPTPLQNVRLLNPTEMLSRFQIDRGAEAGLTIDDLDVDRYPIDGRLQQVLIAAKRARRRRQPEPELAGPPPHQHPRLRAGDGAGRPGAAERPARLPARRADPSRAVLQPDA